MQESVQQLVELEAESRRVKRENVDLAAEVVRLAERSRNHEVEGIDNTGPKKQIAGLEHEVKARRQRWRVMKGTASAIVLGSGVDWDREPRLRDMVLDLADL